MSWNYERSEERIRKHLDGMSEIEVKRLERDADLQNLLTETVCREIYGAHVYVDIANFSQLNQSGDDTTDLRELLRAIHIYQRQVAWIVETVFDGVRVHFQGARVHALFYRPVDDGEVLASKATLLMLVLRDFVRYVFNPLFPDLANLYVCGGADIGTVIGTRNGMRGDRELLFLGEPANNAAKIIDSGIRATAAVHELLPDDLQRVCEEVPDGDIYRLNAIAGDDLTKIADTYDIVWDREAAQARVEADIKNVKVEDVTYSSAEELIDFDSLSVYNNKQILAASLFADISGFTSFVSSAADDDARKHALTGLHLARVEFTRVATHDFNAVRVQFQGDRVQILVHLPKDDRQKISRIAADIAIALQSSMELSLKNVYDGIDGLHLAIGIDCGVVVATRIGQRGHRDRVVLGGSVWAAAANEERSDAREIGVAPEVFSELSESLQEHFQYSKQARCYIAKGLTVAALERSHSAAAAKYAAPAVFVSRVEQGYRITDRESDGGARVVPSKSFGT